MMNDDEMCRLLGLDGMGANEGLTRCNAEFYALR